VRRSTIGADFLMPMEIEMHFCLTCLSLGYCRKLTAFLPTDKEMTPAFVQDGRNFGHQWALRKGLSPERFPSELLGDFSLHPGRLLDPRTQAEADDFEVLFRPLNVTPQQWEVRHSLDCALPDDEERDFRRFYGANYLTPCGPNPHLTYRERHRAVLGILRSLFPAEAARWGLRGDNDNEPI
jgi:hypothetical protein